MRIGSRQTRIEQKTYAKGCVNRQCEVGNMGYNYREPGARIKNLVSVKWDFLSS